MPTFVVDVGNKPFKYNDDYVSWVGIYGQTGRNIVLRARFFFFHGARVISLFGLKRLFFKSLKSRSCPLS